MEFKNLIIDDQSKVRTITINRPQAMNALNNETLTELKAGIMAASEDKAIDVIIITGAGEKAFVAGADIAQLSQQDAKTGRSFAAFGQDVFLTIERCLKPVIAAVNGFALGGGCELAMACHIRIASENAKFGQPEVNLGIIPGYGGTQRLARLVGQGRAYELILTGALINANEAHRIGLANAVTEKGAALKAAQDMAAVISSKGQVAIRYSMQALQAVPEMRLEDGLQHEAALFGLCCGSEDFKEGTTAFLEKRKAEFKGA